jgi:hypothetical protein
MHTHVIWHRTCIQNINSTCLLVFLPYRWLLPSPRSLWPWAIWPWAVWPWAVWPWAVWPGAHSIWACGRSDGSHGDSTPWDSYHSDRATGRDIPDSTRTDCVSPLPAAHHHPHQPQCGPHERCLLPLLLLCWVRGRVGVLYCVEVNQRVAMRSMVNNKRRGRCVSRYV